MKEIKSQEYEIRGKVLAESLKVEELLNRIIYNYFIPKSLDKETRNTFLELFVLNITFGKKYHIYSEILKTDRYRKKVIAVIEKSEIIINDENITDYKHFQKIVKINFQELVQTRNNIAHGFDISKAFLALEEGEMVYANKIKMIKINMGTVENFSYLTAETIKLLELAKRKIQD